LLTNSGAHGLTSILFAYTSCFANNGQAFAGLNANSVFYNATTAVAMLVGRFGLAIPAWAFAASFARQKNAPASSGTLPTESVTFGVSLTACIIVLTALSYLPVLALAPILERLRFGA
jgi:potassium-transporting ATPase potassium-binding subunit